MVTPVAQKVWRARCFLFAEWQLPAAGIQSPTEGQLLPAAKTQGEERCSTQVTTSITNTNTKANLRKKNRRGEKTTEAIGPPTGQHAAEVASHRPTTQVTASPAGVIVAGAGRKQPINSPLREALRS